MPWVLRYMDSQEGLTVQCVFSKNSLGGKNQNKGKNKTSKHASVFPNVNQAAAKQTYFALLSAAEAKASHVSRRICLSPGKVNQAVSLALFYFR